MRMLIVRFSALQFPPYVVLLLWKWFVCFWMFLLGMIRYAYQLWMETIRIQSKILKQKDLNQNISG